jgi:hypothetical protein
MATSGADVVPVPKAPPDQPLHHEEPSVFSTLQPSLTRFVIYTVDNIDNKPTSVYCN